MDQYLLAEHITNLTEVGAAWLAYGIGLGGIAWVVGQGILLIYNIVRY